jgi:hypothetical protein
MVNIRCNDLSKIVGPSRVNKSTWISICRAIGDRDSISNEKEISIRQAWPIRQLPAHFNNALHQTTHRR